MPQGWNADVDILAVLQPGSAFFGTDLTEPDLRRELLPATDPAQSQTRLAGAVPVGVTQLGAARQTVP